MDLPSEVHVVHNKRSGRTYYYWVPNRGTRKEGERRSLPRDPRSPDFWAAIEALGGSNPNRPAGSVAELVALFRASVAYTSLATSTRDAYEVHMRRFERVAGGWGRLPARDLTPLVANTLRDAMAKTPHMANQMLSVGGTIWSWAIPLGHLGPRPINPFDEIRPLETPDRGHVPWPEWARSFVLERAPDDLRRFVRLSLMTGQRESDVVRFGPDMRENNGLWCRPRKTRKRRRAFFISLALTEALELDRWATRPIAFRNSRWLQPIEKHRADLYVYTPRAQPYTPDRIRARWGRWLATADGRDLCRRWHAWLRLQVARYGWEIEPDEVRGPTLHGLRGTAVLIRRGHGYDDQQISNDIGMSKPMVQHYTRFVDQMDAAEANRARLEVVGGTRS